METCEHCGTEADDYDIEIFHRSCRLSAAFPAAASQEGALVTFNMDAIRDKLGWDAGIETEAGVRFQHWDRIYDRDEIWVSVETRVGSSLSSWSWRVSISEWQQVVAHIESRLAEKAQSQEPAR